MTGVMTVAMEEARGKAVADAWGGGVGGSARAAGGGSLRDMRVVLHAALLTSERRAAALRQVPR
jgi:hypothetical protein